MKKLMMIILAVMMLAGCTQTKKETTFMITKDNELYALYNSEGEKLTEYAYKTFEEVSDLGYIVTNEKDEKSFISLKGKEIIAAGTYATIEAAGRMLYATKALEQPTDGTSLPEVDYNNFQTSNLYVLNGAGEILYEASDTVSIKKSGLPIILKDNQYIVLYEEGKELYKDDASVEYVNQVNNSSCVIIGFEENEKFYSFNTTDENKNIELTIKEKGTYSILDQNEQGVILNDNNASSMIYVDLANAKYYANTILINDAYFDESYNIILTNDQLTYIYPIGKEPVLMTSYYLSSEAYVTRSVNIYGPHDIYKDGKKTGSLENCQFYPAASAIESEIFPVYQRDTGYQYYDFDCKKVIDETYLEAQPFDKNLRAIVKVKEDGYSLIDDKGTVLTKTEYNQMKYIGSSYYAVYNKDGSYGIIDVDGNEVLPLEYTSLTKKPITVYNEVTYLTLNKNGRGYVYDTEDDMKVIFSAEGNVIFNEKGYFTVGNQYYTFDGDLMK